MLCGRRALTVGRHHRAHGNPSDGRNDVEGVGEKHESTDHRCIDVNDDH